MRWLMALATAASIIWFFGHASKTERLRPRVKGAEPAERWSATSRTLSLLATEPRCVSDSARRSTQPPAHLMSQAQIEGWSAGGHTLTMPDASLSANERSANRKAYARIAAHLARDRSSAATEFLELPEINLAAANHVCQRGTSHPQYTRSSAQKFSPANAAPTACQTSPQLVARTCQNAHRYTTERTVGAWHDSLVGVLPCLELRNVSDHSDKYCTPKWSRAEMCGAPTRPEQAPLVSWHDGATLYLHESHGGNIWHFVREAMTLVKTLKDVRSLGIRGLAVEYLIHDGSDLKTEKRVDGEDDLVLKSQWQRNVVEMVTEGYGIRPQTVGNMAGNVTRCFDSVLTKLTLSLSFEPEAGRELKRLAWRKCSCGDTPSANRTLLLVTRKSSRVLGNADEAVDILKRAARTLFEGLGMHLRVETLNPGVASFCEQVRAFAEAKVILSISGSDLTNAIWARYDSVAVEMFPTNFLNTTNAFAIGRTPDLESIMDRGATNDFAIYLGRMGQMYLQAYATIPVTTGAKFFAGWSEGKRVYRPPMTREECLTHKAYYYGSGSACVHMLQLDRLWTALVRARVLMDLQDALHKPARPLHYGYV